MMGDGDAKLIKAVSTSFKGEDLKTSDLDEKIQGAKVHTPQVGKRLSSS